MGGFDFTVQEATVGEDGRKARVEGFCKIAAEGVLSMVARARRVPGETYDVGREHISIRHLFSILRATPAVAGCGSDATSAGICVKPKQMSSKVARTCGMRAWS